jgi:hypothetical protein
MYSSRNAIRINQSRKENGQAMRRRIGMRIGYWWESQKERE